MDQNEKKVPDFFENRAEKQDDTDMDDSFEKAKERLNFDVSGNNTDEEDDQDAVPYDFRAEYKERIGQDLSENEEETEKHFMSIKMHAIGIGALIGILVALLIGVFLFGSDEQLETTEKPIVVKESSRPIKVRPTNPGGMEIPDQDKTIYKRMRSDSVDTKAETINVSDEEPVRPQVKTKEGEILGKPQPVATAEQMEWEVLNLKDKAVQTPVVKEALIQVKPVPVPVKQVAKSVQKEPAKQVEKPIQKDVAKSEEVIYGKPVSPVVENKKTVAKSASKATTDANVWHVQLISMTSKAAANKEWPKILKAHTALLSGLPHDIKEVDVKGKTFYRLRVGEFKNKNEAQNLCNKLKSRKQDCTLTK